MNKKIVSIDLLKALRKVGVSYKDYESKVEQAKAKDKPTKLLSLILKGRDIKQYIEDKEQ